MGSRLEKGIALGLLALVVLFVLLSGGGGERAADARPSSFHASPGGTLALYLALQELGTPVGRRTTPFAGADSLRGPLVLLAPAEAPEGNDLEALARWIEGGGTLVYAARMGDPTLDTLGLVLAPAEPDMAAEDWRGMMSADAFPRAHPWTEGADTVPGFETVFADTSPALRDATPLLVTREGEMAAAVFTKGKGRVVAFSDAGPLGNAALREGGAPVLFARMAAELSGGRRVWFDEYHHGYQAGEAPPSATGRFLRAHPLGHAALQLALAGVVLLLLHMRRFGAPLPPPAARRRSPLEHVEALAGAYRQAGARRTARRLLLAGLARRLGRRPPRDAKEEREMMERLGALPAAGEAARGLDREIKKGEEADLAALSRGMDRLLEEVRRP